MEFPEGSGAGGGVSEKNPFCGGGMDMFWNYTLEFYCYPLERCNNNNSEYE